MADVWATMLIEGGLDPMSSIVEDPAGNRLLVLAVHRERPYSNGADGDDPIILLEPVDSTGAVVGGLYIRPFPLGEARCGNVTEIATPTGGEPGESAAGESEALPATVIALRPTCATDVAR